MGMMGGCPGMMGVGILLLLGLVAGVIAAVLYVARGAGRGAPVPTAARAAGEDRALATLRERFAHGEIDRAEYEERRAALAAGEMEWA